MSEVFTNESGRPMTAVLVNKPPEGSPEWRHEMRHKWQESEWGLLSYIAQQEFWSLSATALFLLIYKQLGITSFFDLALWTFFYYFVIMFSIEMDAVTASMRKNGEGFFPRKPQWMKKKKEEAKACVA